MQFYARCSNLRVIVDPMVPVRDHMGRVVETRKGLSAQFNNHYFDSAHARETYDWTEEDEDRVVAHLLKMSEKGEDGIHPADHAEAAKFSPQVAAPQLTDCVAILKGKNGKPPTVCGKPAVEGMLHCTDHLEDDEKAKLAELEPVS